ncbi:hypothetical protein F5Y01DRAFT_324793 [Xylaria sp. FL0043]|nr:hypothetical protein F5Y01DRAFT_324793 [Xylaria sp. FL0043]
MIQPTIVMPSSFYRVYICFGKNNCVRFLAPGKGTIAGEGLNLFQWIRDPVNIARLRNGLQHVYEVDHKELRRFLAFKIREDLEGIGEHMDKHLGGSDTLAISKQKQAQFNRLPTGIDKLNAIANAKEMTVIPRVAPRTRTETLEVYEFEDYKPDQLSPFSRLTIESLYERSPDKPPGYCIKLKLLELQTMTRSEWIDLHEFYEEALGRLWKRNARVLQAIPHADSIPFAVLYGSLFHGYDGQVTTSWHGPRRLTQERLTKVLANMNNRQASSIPIIERKRIWPRRVADDRLRRLHKGMFRLRGEAIQERRRKRTHSL